jgi:Cu-processing system permease protein
MIMLGLDIAALMGYTGALFLKFFGSATGIAITIFSMLCWIAIPSFMMVRIANKKDF